jgi:cytochrome P450
LKATSLQGKDCLNLPLSDEQLMMIGFDMIFASTSSPQIAMAFMLKQLANHPKVVAKCQAEIDSVVGSGRLPELDDRAQ